MLQEARAGLGWVDPDEIRSQIDWPGTPQPKQEMFLEMIRSQETKHPFIGGARGGGKSWVFRRGILERRLQYPGSTGLLLRRTYPELRVNHIIRFWNELKPKSYIYNDGNHEFIFPNGSRQILGFCRNDKDVQRYQGHEYDDIWIDEITHWQELWFEMLTACARTTRRGIRPLVVVSGNPGGIGHAWVKRRWIDRDFNDNENPDDYDFVPATVDDNLILMERQPDYVATLESISDENLRRAWRWGDWDAFAGQFFHELRREIHGFTGDPPAGWTFRCFDYGESAPSAVYWCRVDSEGHVWLFRELYQSGLIYSKLAKKILALDAGEPIRYTVGSPDIFNVSKGTGVVGAETMAAAGVPVIRADNNRIEGWRHMREWLDPEDPHLHVHLENCRHWWRTVPVQVYDEHVSEDMDPDGEDHPAESTRYGLMSRPRPARKPVATASRYSSAGILARQRKSNTKKPSV